MADLGLGRMKSTHMIVIGVVLLIVGGQFKPHVNQSYALMVAIILDVCVVAGLLTLIIGAIRQYKEKNTEY